jgi:hypothetical protein
VKKLSSVRHILPAALLVLSAAIFTCGQGVQNIKQNARPERPAVPAPTPESRPDSVEYTYEFSQPKFYVKHILIKHDSNGHGTITFERMNEDVPVAEPLELSATAMARISALWQALKFLDSDTDYQSSQQFPHLGTMRLGMKDGSRQRVAEFNWTHNESAASLVGEYRKAADQAVFVLDMAIARENLPLNAPKLMEVLESMLTRNGLSDPKQLLPLLRDISTDEHVPLIARNHALRLIKKIEK